MFSYNYFFLKKSLFEGKFSCFFRRWDCTWVQLQNAQLFSVLQRNSAPRMPEGASSDSEDLSLIPGFGFLPQTMVSRAERIFQAKYIFM